MEAARIPWRPLGRILVEQGLLTSEELETALAQQERTGKRLGETIVECGFVSGPELSSALASQYGIELTTETGFGTGLRTQIQRRHENERRGARPSLVDVSLDAPDLDEPAEPPLEFAGTTPAEASLLAQLEEQWARLAAAEARLSEQEQELASVAVERDRRRGQAVRFARAARAGVSAPDVPALDDGLREHCARLEDEIRAGAEEIDRLRDESAHTHDRRAALEQSLAEREAELAHARGELAAAHEAVSSAQAAIADQERRHHEFGAEFERIVHARAEIQQNLSSVQAELEERSRRVDELQAELAQAHAALAGAETAVAEQNHRLDELAAELERVVESRTTLEQEHTHLHARHDRRRRQAERLARRARARATTRDEDDVRNGRIEELQAELAQAHGALADAVTALADQNQRLDELAGELERVVHSRAELEQELARVGAQHDRRRRQAERLARRARARTVTTGRDEDARPHVEELRRQVDDLSTEARSRQHELEHLRHERAQAHERVASLEQSLAERDPELARLRRADEQQLAQIERLVADVRGCDEEIARLRSENERARAQTKRFLERLQRAREHVGSHAEPVLATSHLVFVELPDRYALVERDGPAPARDTQLEVPELDRRLVVAGVRRSPLPDDGRPCVVARTPVPAAAP